MKITSPLDSARWQRSRATLVILFLTPCFTNMAVAQPAPPAGRPPTPSSSASRFTVADGFEVSLFAADPMLAKPIQMNFDPAGRLWVATSEIYPQIKPGQKRRRQDPRPRRHQRRRQGRQGHRLRRRPAHPHRRRSPATAACYVANSTEIAPLQRHRRRRQGRPAPRRPLRLRHRRHPPHHPHLPLGPRRHLLFQSERLHPFARRNALRLRAASTAGGTWALPPRDPAARGLLPRPDQPLGPRLGQVRRLLHDRRRRRRGHPLRLSGRLLLVAQRPGPAHPAPHRARPQPRSPKFAGAEVISGRHLPDDWQGDCITNDFRANRVVPLQAQ